MNSYCVYSVPAYLTKDTALSFAGDLEYIPKLEYPASTEVLNTSGVDGSSTSKITLDSSLDVEMSDT